MTMDKQKRTKNALASIHSIYIFVWQNVKTVSSRSFSLTLLHLKAVKFVKSNIKMKLFVLLMPILGRAFMEGRP